MGRLTLKNQLTWHRRQPSLCHLCHLRRLCRRLCRLYLHSGPKLRALATCAIFILPRVDEPALGFFMPSPVIVTLFAVPFLSLLRVDKPALGFFIPSPIIVSLVTDGRAVLCKVASLTAIMATAHVFFGCRTIFCKVASLTAIIATALVFFGFNLFFGRLSLPHQRADEFFGVVFVTDEARHFVIVCHCWRAQCN